MSLTFSRSLRSLGADSFRPSLLGIAIATALLAAWLLWFLLAEVPVYEISSEARLESASAAHAIDAPVAGRVVSVAMAVGQVVVAGQELVVLDTERETSRVAEGDARLQGLAARIDALNQERVAELESSVNQRRADLAAIEGAEARHQEAVSSVRLADAEARRTAELLDQGLASAADFERGSEVAEQKRSAASAAASDLERLRLQSDQHEGGRRATVADIDRQIAALEAEVEQAHAASRRLGREVSDRLIEAPVAGRLGEVAELRPGSVVDEGERIAVVIPSGSVIVVSRFPVASALGRVKAGQHGTMRLDAFPWIHHGQVDVQVTRVGTEAADGVIRVELEIEQPLPEIELEHGLSGTVAVAVEQVSPAHLILRAVGKRASGIH